MAGMDTARRLRLIAADWRQVRPDLDPVPMTRCILLRRTALALASGIEQAQRPLGLNHALSDLLLTLYRSAPAAGLSAGELGELSAIRPSSVTHRLDRLEAEGLIERLTDEDDARARRIRLTAAGRRRVEELLPLHLANERDLLSGLSETEQQQLEHLLLKLVEHLEAREAEG